MRTFANAIFVIGCCGFIAILVLSAVFDRTIVWLHIFQAVMYIVAIALVAVRSRWGYALGFSIAAFWNYVNLFVTSFLRNGLDALARLLATGHLSRLDQLIAVAAVGFHFMMIGGAVTALCLRPRSTASDVVRILITLIASVAYFAAIIAAFQPRYFELFPRLLHPHAFGG
jgi:hypothetical protein